MPDGRGGRRVGAGKPKGTVHARTKAIRARILRDQALSVETTVESIRRGQQYDPRAFFDEAGNLRPIHTLSEADAWAIAGFDVVRRNLEGGDGHTDTVVKVKLADRRGYVELAARHQGMLTEKHDVTIHEAVGTRLEQARAAAQQRNARPPKP